jgi:hypothetical protein
MDASRQPCGTCQPTGLDTRSYTYVGNIPTLRQGCIPNSAGLPGRLGATGVGFGANSSFANDLVSDPIFHSMESAHSSAGPLATIPRLYPPSSYP